MCLQVCITAWGIFITFHSDGSNLFICKAKTLLKLELFAIKEKDTEGNGSNLWLLHGREWAICIQLNCWRCDRTKRIILNYEGEHNAINLVVQRNTNTIHRNQPLFTEVITAGSWLLFSPEQSQAYFCIAFKLTKRQIVSQRDIECPGFPFSAWVLACWCN